MSSLSGKTALVTGAGGGIGRSTAIRLGAQGAKVAVHYRRDLTGATDTVDAIKRAGGQAFAVQADLSEEGAAGWLWKRFDQHEDAVDIVVNSAGQPGKGGFAGVAEEDFARLFRLNLNAPLFIIKEALMRMLDGGRIINISTVGVSVALPPEVMYASLKGGVDAMTRNLAWELRGRRITVNSVAPGFTETPTFDPCLGNPQVASWETTLTARHEIAQPWDVANVVTFLVSDEAAWVTGQVLDVSGGTVVGVPDIPH